MKRIGIMLDGALIDRAVAGKPTYERLDYYVEIGKELGIEPVFFHPRHVHWKSRRVTGYFWNGKRLVPRLIKIPSVIHNRVLSGQPQARAMIRQLSKAYKVYNEIVVRDKYRVHQMLWENPEIRKYLPQTTLFSRPSMREQLHAHSVVYVKPSIGSVGHGVVRIEKQGNRFASISSKHRRLLTKDTLWREMKQWVGTRRFLIQTGVPLATYQGETFDIRVSVQRNRDHDWCVSGMVAKLANAQNKLSNLARGGRAEKLGHVFEQLFTVEQAEAAKKRLEQAALLIAKQYAKHYPSLADLGMDMGIDKQGNPYLIEVNVRDQRYSFFAAGELEMFQRTYRHPMEYGKTFLS